MQQVVNDNGATGALPEQVPGLRQPQVCGFLEQCLQYTLVMGEILDAGTLAARQAMSR
ncbi:hypothetical protein D3C78_1972730 [compost metagenome]